MRFEIFPWKDNKVGVRLVGKNGEVVMHSEGYHNAGNARRAIKRMKAEVADAKVVELKPKKEASDVR